MGLSQDVIALDDFLPDPVSYRAMSLELPFYDIRYSDGELYKHVNVRPPQEVAPHLEQRLGKKVTLDYCITRLNYSGELPNNSVHTDDAWSNYAYVLFLNPPDQCRGGTAFWQHKKYRWTNFPTKQEVLRTGKSEQRIYSMLREDMNREDAWDLLHVADMKFNRAICFPCSRWHSRWPWAAFGSGKTDARLINVGFFSVA